MTLAFYVDEGVSDEVARGAALAGLDVLTAKTDRFRNKPDIAVLERAASLGRVLLACDTDFLAIADSMLAHGSSLPPIVFFAQNTLSVGRIVSDLAIIAHLASPQDFAHEVMRLPL